MPSHDYRIWWPYHLSPLFLHFGLIVKLKVVKFSLKILYTSEHINHKNIGICKQIIICKQISMPCYVLMDDKGLLCILQGKFSPKSDVWSFAVTLWEILTLAREQPFDQLSDEHVIENCSHCYHGDGQEQWLTRPTNCPKEIFDLMRECWNREVTSRPAFCEIHMFLQRKNMGYSPYDERPTPTKFSVPIV